MSGVSSTSNVVRWLGLVALGVFCSVGCSSDAKNEGGDGKGGDGSGSGGNSSGGSGNNDPSACTSTSSCDDGFSCTIDSCANGNCNHTIGPNEGPTACPTGQYCTLPSGCVESPACETNNDCITVWAGDACKTMPRCDAVSSVCIFTLLDKDDDGHAPQVCGGDDCNDDASEVYPGATEGCDGKDNDCEGTVDENATCANPTEECYHGACSSCDGTRCGDDCADLMTDPKHCGDCSQACPLTLPSCSNGQCVSSPVVEHCQALYALFCNKMFTCFSPAQFDTSMFGTTEAECNERFSRAECTNQRAKCDGGKEYQAAAGQACLDQLGAVSCEQFTDIATGATEPASCSDAAICQ